QAGTFTLPEITVPWWNPHLKRQEVATLPARTIVVKGSAPNDVTEPPLWQTEVDSVNYWPWLSALFAALWLMTLVAWRRALKRVGALATAAPATLNAPAPKPSVSTLAALERACAEGSASEILSQLQRYFSQKTGQSLTLDKIAARTAPLAEAISQLQACAYGANIGLNEEAQQRELALATAALLKAVISEADEPAVNTVPILGPLHP
ncbi:MAG: BatD family protein, partial [Shewanella sp.]